MKRLLCGRPAITMPHGFYVGLILVFFKLLGYSNAALAVEWREDRPLSYRVVEGDTLWTIAGRFLKHAWEWPEVWRENAQIQNPDLIYPGDLIVLDARGGQPYLRLEVSRMTGGVEDDRLSPRIRVTPLAEPIPVIPLKAISPFLTRPRVIEIETLDHLPYVVGLAEEHVIGSPGDRLFVRSILKPTPVDYSIFRPGVEYRDPESDKVLGHEALFIAEGYLEQTGDPASVMLTRAEKEARPGDRLMPGQRVEIGEGYLPHAPRKGLAGHIIGVMDGVSQIGQFSVVTLDRGAMNGVESGHVFEIWQKGPQIRDTVNPSFGQKLIGPEQKAGELMVFLTFRRVSFALVMNAERFIHVLDVIRSP